MKQGQRRERQRATEKKRGKEPGHQKNETGCKEGGKKERLEIAQSCSSRNQKCWFLVGVQMIPLIHTNPKIHGSTEEHWQHHQYTYCNHFPTCIHSAHLPPWASSNTCMSFHRCPNTTRLEIFSNLFFICSSLGSKHELVFSPHHSAVETQNAAARSLVFLFWTTFDRD